MAGDERIIRKLVPNDSPFHQASSCRRLFWYTVCCDAMMLLYCYIVILLYCYVVMLLYCYVVMLLCWNVW
jgi:hypothetical protein